MSYIRIIDDDAELAENLSLFLKQEGHTVSVLDDTKGALQDLVQDKPDLLILDVMFPENHTAGFDLARKIRQTREIKDLPVILLTGVNQQFPLSFSAKDIDGDWMPVHDFIEKPVDMKTLLQKVKSLLQKSAE